MATPTEWNECNLQIETQSAVINTVDNQLEVKFRVINYFTGDDTARMVRVIILLPINVNVKDVDVDEKKKGLAGYKEPPNCKGCENCEVNWNASVTIGRAGGKRKVYHDSTVCIDLGYLNRYFDEEREGDFADKEEAIITVKTTIPDVEGVAKSFAAFVYGSVPDKEFERNYTVATCVVPGP